LHEVRRLVNKIKEEYGKPKKIVVEMARELKNTKKARQKALKQNKENRKLNEDAEKWVAENTSIKNPKYDDILKYKLWIECDKTCPYTGKSICKTDLFEEPVFQIEHILPYERTRDDSYMNKTLCYVDENVHVKGGRTPFEAYSDKPEKYEDIKQRISCLPPPKRERFLQDKIPEGHIERELNDTRYITRETIKYLRKLGVIVKGTRGAATNALRHSWGLDGIFTELGVGRDEDHRKHAVDAVIVAVTTSKELHTLSKTKYSKVKKTFPPPENWPHFREELAEKVKHIDVSHRVTKRVSGKLHEGTFYGLTKEAKADFKKGNFKKVEMRQLSKNAWLCRKKFSYIYSRPPQEILKKVNDLDGITNDAKNVKDAIRKRLMENGISIENKKAKIPKDLFKESLYLQSNKGKKIPVKKIRVCKPFSNMIIFTDKEGNPYRGVAPGSNHHIEILEYRDKKGTVKRGGEVVSLFEAVRRKKDGEPVVKREHGPDKKFVCSLSINEMVMMPNNKGEVDLYRVQKMSINKQIYFRHHTAATINDDSTLIRKQVSQFDGYKVTVDPLGRIHRAND
jgi:CRISPR-associated endonuclease Csn1